MGGRHWQWRWWKQKFHLECHTWRDLLQWHEWSSRGSIFKNLRLFSKHPNTSLLSYSWANKLKGLFVSHFWMPVLLSPFALLWKCSWRWLHSPPMDTGSRGETVETCLSPFLGSPGLCLTMFLITRYIINQSWNILMQPLLYELTCHWSGFQLEKGATSPKNTLRTQFWHLKSTKFQMIWLCHFWVMHDIS